MCANGNIDGDKPTVEVTDEMIEAGLEVFLGAYPDTGTGDAADRRMIREIYLAMRG